MISLLFQTGYLTIKSVKRSLWGEEYRLGYPNREVADAFQQHLLTDYLQTSSHQLQTAFLTDMERAVRAYDISTFIVYLQSVFAGTPYTLFLEEEAYYHSVVYLVLRLLDFQITLERLTNLERIDAVLELADVVDILEFKMTTAKVAMQQMRNKEYAASYPGRNKTIILLGIAFDKSKRNIGDWQSEIVKST